MSDFLFNRQLLSDEDFLSSIFSTRGYIPGDWFIRYGHKSDGPTGFCKLADLLKNLDPREENYISYSYISGGQSDEDTQMIEAVVIDLDGMATEEQVQLVCQLCPGALVTWANGVQVVFRPSFNKELLIVEWHKVVGELVALGEYLAAETGLFFDRHCCIRNCGRAARHRNHTYRGPGWAAKAGRPVLFLAPVDGGMVDTAAAVKALGLKAVEVLPVEGEEKDDDETGVDREGERDTQPTSSMNLYSVSRIGVTLTGSLAPQNDEYKTILNAWCHGVYTQGKPRQVVEAEICSMPWEHHKPDALAKSLAKLKIYNLSDGSRLSDEQWESVQKDLEDLGNWIGPRSQRRNALQKTTTLRANRAWSFEFLYFFKNSPYYNMTLPEAITAFWSWSEFESIREMSMSALKSATAVEADLKRCWGLFGDRATAVSKQAVEQVEAAICELRNGNFTRSDIEDALPEMSERKLKRALAELAKQGKIQMKKAGRSSSYALPGAAPAEQPTPKKTSKRFKSTPTTPPPAPVPTDDFERCLGLALVGKGDGHWKDQGEPQTIKNKEKFKELYQEVFTAVSCRDGEFKGPSISRLYGLLAKKCPSGFDCSTVYLDCKGDYCLADLVAEKAVPADEFKANPHLYPILNNASDIIIVERKGGVIIQDFGTLAIKVAAESIEKVIAPHEMASLLSTLEKKPWLKSSKGSLTFLNHIGYEKLKAWFSKELGEKVTALYLGEKPERDGMPFQLNVDGVKLAVSPCNSWSTKRFVRVPALAGSKNTSV